MLDKTLRQVLKQAGLQYTKQRASVLDVIRTGGRHFDAYEVHKEIGRLGKPMSLSTVYRILQAFKECGLITENHLGEDHHHYEVDSGEIHHHAVCTDCGRVIEFDLPTEDIVGLTPELENFVVSAVEFSLEGLCDRCRKHEGIDE